MQAKKKINKIPLFFVITNFITAFGCILWLLLSGSDAPQLTYASVGASAFFFLTAGFVILTIAKANLPSFKFDKQDD